MIGVTSVCVIMTLSAVHGISTTISTPTSSSPPPPPPPTTTTMTTTTLTPTAISSSNSTSLEASAGIQSTNSITTSPASDSSSATPATLTSSPNNMITTAATTSSATNPTITKSGLNQQEQIAIISFAVLAITALIVAFVAILSVRINRAREKPRSNQMEMRHMNGNPSVPQGYSSSEYSSHVSDGNTSGSHGNVSFSVEPLVRD